MVDCRRSGINGLATVRERVILPKVTDFVKSVRRLLERKAEGDELELFSTDFRDAFHMLPLCESERKFVVYKNSKGQYHISRVVVFGLSAGPLLWARLASSAMRLGQAATRDGELAMACYVDDPLMGIMGKDARSRMKVFCVCAVIWRSIGLELSWKKGCHGRQLQWIGFELALSGPANGDITVRMAESKRQKLMETFKELMACAGMIPLWQLRYATGVIGWASSIVASTRPWLAMLYAACTQHQQSKKSTTRQRKGLVFVKQVEHAVRWLHALIQEMDADRPGLAKTFRYRPEPRYIMLQTDACPTGMGGFIMMGNDYVAYWSSPVLEEDLQLMGSSPGDPSFQSEWETLAVWISLEAFKEWLLDENHPVQVILRTDNMAVIHAVNELRARSPIMTQLTAEISMQVELLQLLPLQAQHVPGVLNKIADSLSRQSTEQSVPWQLQHSRCIPAPQRTAKDFRAWP